MCECRFLCTVDRMKTSGCANLQNVTISNSKKFCAACRSHLTFIHFVLLSFHFCVCVCISVVPTDFLRCYVSAVFALWFTIRLFGRFWFVHTRIVVFSARPFWRPKSNGEQSQKFSAWLSFRRGDTGFATSKVQNIVVFLHRHWPRAHISV